MAEQAAGTEHKSDKMVMADSKLDELNEDGSIAAVAPMAEKKTLTRRILGVVWDSLDKSPEERKFVHIADCWILTYVCIAYFVKYLDQTNVVNAYVSGMQQDLHMSGQDYNLLQTMFTVGYVIGNLPSQIIMIKIRPSLWLPSLELIWGFLVMAMAGAKNVQTLYVLRFFIGLLEASAYPGVLTLLGNWYTPAELGKRSTIFICSAFAAQMFSGYLQAGLYAGMDGRAGLAAWQWLFIFDGLIGVPVCLVGYFAIPDSPTTTKARWMKPQYRAMAIARMERVRRSPPRRLTWRTFADVFTGWPVWVFALAFTAQLNGIRIYNYFTIYLKSVGFSVEQTNVIPTGGFALQIVSGVLCAWVSDATGWRAPVIMAASLVSLVGCAILSVYPAQNKAAMMVGWILTYFETGASALIIVWLNEILAFSSEQRAVAIGVVEATAFAMNAWIILVAYPSGDAPRFAVGYEIAAMFFGLEIVAMAIAWYCCKRWMPKGSTPPAA